MATRARGEPFLLRAALARERERGRAVAMHRAVLTLLLLGTGCGPAPKVKQVHLRELQGIDLAVVFTNLVSASLQRSNIDFEGVLSSCGYELVRHTRVGSNRVTTMKRTGRQGEELKVMFGVMGGRDGDSVGIPRLVVSSRTEESRDALARICELPAGAADIELMFRLEKMSSNELVGPWVIALTVGFRVGTRDRTRSGVCTLASGLRGYQFLWAK